MKTMLIIMYVYVTANVLFSPISYVRPVATHINRETRKILGVFQVLSGMVISVLSNYIFPERTMMFWIMFVATIILLVCGFINLVLYMCSIE